ncbi:hypothetical protein NP493_319g00012 [Ridgeia piscesae]|uniref:Uncharacterized protein n=1 Tax=Ridgeia piscesae TaxID=27915 RepID=A0AAD9L4R2_RIDPI|nr:hypothetical protein NP493_319g00012 [Ridgeia piscesae]
MRWRHFAAAMNELIGECSKRPQPTFTNTQRQLQLRTISSYPNDKPWFNIYIKHKLQAKQDAYKDNSKNKYKKARYATEKAVKTGKAKYRDKLEENLTTNNSKNIWQGLKAIINCKPSPKNTTTTDASLPDKLNDFYSRFDKENTIPSSSVTGFHCDEPPSSFSLLSQLTNLL